MTESTQQILTTKDRSSELLTYVTDVVQPEESNRWKSINTHSALVLLINANQRPSDFFNVIKLLRISPYAVLAEK